MLLVALVAYLERGPIAARLAESYLRRKGVPARIVFQRLETDGFTAQMSLGPAADPDLVVDTVQVQLGSSFRVRSIRLVGPHLKARLDAGRLRFGSLQTLVDELLSAPAGPLPPPDVVIERGDARLSGGFGELHLVDAAAAITGGRLIRLNLRAAPARLRFGSAEAAIDQGLLSARSDGGVLAARLRLTGSALTQPGASVRAWQAALDARLPYPAARLDGPATAGLVLTAASADAGGSRLEAPRLSLDLAGDLQGEIERLAFTGTGKLGLVAGGWRAPAGSGAGAKLDAALSGLRLARAPEGLRLALAALDATANLDAPRYAAAQAPALRATARLHGVEGLIAAGRGTLNATVVAGASAPRLTAKPVRIGAATADLSASQAALAWDAHGWSLAGPVRLRARAAEAVTPVDGGELVQRGLALDVAGDARLGAAPRLALAGSIRTASGGFSPRAAARLADTVPMVSTDEAGRPALLRALQGFHLEAPAVSARLENGRAALALSRPLELIAAGDGRARLTQSAPDAFRLAVSGGGLPQVDADLSALHVDQDRGGLAFGAAARASLAFSGASMSGAELQFAGPLARRNGVISLAAPTCGRLAIARFGEAAIPLLTGLEAQVCADAGRPLFTLGQGWALRSRLTGLRFLAPGSEARIADAVVAFSMTGAPGAAEPTGRADVTGLRITDAAAVRRFEPLTAAGPATLSRGVWGGSLQIAEAAHGRPLADVAFTHVMATSSGHADIAAPALSFTRDGLQPRDLTPIGAEMASQVEGVVSFQGGADWAPSGLTSRGRFATAGLDLKSAFGAVKRLRSTIELTSLAPLLSSPDQPLTIDEIGWLVPLTKATAGVTLQLDRIHLAGAGAEAAGGKLTLDPLDLPFDPAAALSGVVRLKDIDLAQLIDRFNLADKVKLQAHLDGALPFRLQAGTIRVTAGSVFAVGPGRLTINREALSGASAAASPGAPLPPNGMQLFAYQALEDLAFDALDAQVDSRPMGRLQVVFHVRGRHDPPKGGETRIGLFDLIGGHAFDKPVDLPKGTPVNLTLDTSLNLDELLAAYADGGRSESVQPPTPKP